MRALHHHREFPRVKMCRAPPSPSDAMNRRRPLRSLDDLVGSDEQRLGDGEPESLRSLHVYDQLELSGLFHWEIGRLGTLEDFVDVTSRAPPVGGDALAVEHQAPRFHESSGV